MQIHLIRSLDTEDFVEFLPHFGAEAFDKYCPNLEYLGLFDMQINFNTSKPIFARLKSLKIVNCGIGY